MRFALFLVVLGAVFILPHLGRRDLWPPDEGRYAEMATALEQGRTHPLIPLSNGRLYPDKPAGYVLSINGASRLMGHLDAGVARIPSAVGAMLCMVVAGLMAASVWGVLGGVLSALSLLAMHQFSWQARYVQMDMLVAGLTALMIGLLFAARRPGRRAWGAVAMVLLALGILVKGPLIALALVGFALWVIWERQPGALFNRWVAIGLVAGVAILYWWYRSTYAALEARGPGSTEPYFDMMFGRHLAHRMHGEVAHAKPFWSYLRMLPMGMLPLTPLLLLYASSRIRAALSQPAKSLVRLAICWTLVYLVLLSFAPGKREIYLQPAYPALGILLGGAMVLGLQGGHAFLRGFARAMGIVLCLAAAAALVVVLFPDVALDNLGALEAKLAERGHDLRAQVVGARGDVITWAALFGAVALLGQWLLGQRLKRGLVATLLAVALFLNGAWALLLPHANPFISRRQLADKVSAIWDESGVIAPIWCFLHKDEGIPYYLGCPTPEVPEPDWTGERKRVDGSQPGDGEFVRSAVAEALNQPGALMFARRKRLELFGLEEGRHYQVRDRGWAGSKEFLIIEEVK